MREHEIEKIKTNDVRDFYADQFFELREILLNTDPMGLFKRTEMIDEYDLEVKYIILQINEVSKTIEAITAFIITQFEICLYPLPKSTKLKFKPTGQLVYEWLLKKTIKPYANEY